MLYYIFCFKILNVYFCSTRRVLENSRPNLKEWTCFFSFNWIVRKAWNLSYMPNVIRYGISIWDSIYISRIKLILLLVRPKLFSPFCKISYWYRHLIFFFFYLFIKKLSIMKQGQFLSCLTGFHSVFLLDWLPYLD